MDPKSDPSLSDSSSSEFYLSNVTNYSESKKKKRNKNKNHQKHKKQDLSDSSSSDYDSSDNSDYRCKRHNNNIHWKKDPIKLCARLTAKLLTTAYKSKIIKFKMDEDLIQRRICFLDFLESLEMIFFQYKETCEVLLYYPKIGEGNIKDFVKNTIKNILHNNIDVHNRRLIAKFPVDGVKCIEKVQSHCVNRNFSVRVDMKVPFNKSHIK